MAKLLLLDQSDYSTQHVFFDDKADDEDDCIVDVRDYKTQEIVPWKKFIRKNVIKVVPHRAILEPDYFVQMIELADKNRNTEIARMEAGIDEDQDVKEPTKDIDEWQLLKELSDEEYLMRTILPVLHQGMKQVEQQRPVAPVEYLAIYLLKN